MLDLSFAPFTTTIGGHQLQIMRADDDHLIDLLNLESEVYSGSTPWSSFSFKRELRKHRNSLYLVAYEGPSLAGFVGARYNIGEGHITNIAVKPRLQNCGIGAFLLNLMIDRARLNDCCQVTLEVRVDNRRAQRLYRRIGFVPNFVRKDYYVTDHVDALDMVLKLDQKKKEAAD